MKKISSALILTSLLVGCGGDDKTKDYQISENSYAVQMVAADYSSSQVAVGNLEGDRTAVQSLLVQDKSNFTISTFENTLYHIGKKDIDTLDTYIATNSLENSISTHSLSDDNAPSSNTYTLIQQNANNAYLIRYGSTSIMQVDPANDLVTGNIDLSHYTFEGAEVPRMVDAKIVDNKLFVALQRLGASWSYEQAYVAVIDLVTNIEIDTNPQQEGLKGIPLNGKNPLTIESHNGQLYVAGRGNYGSDTGALDKIDATTYEITNLIDNTSFPNLIDFSDDEDSTNDTYYHVTDVAVVSDQLAYAALNIEKGYTTLETKLASVNPTTGIFTLLAEPAELSAKEISDINIDANDRLWLGIANSDAPGILVMDTDTNTINGEIIELDMPAKRIEFLTVQ
jgi:hypothetical protein